VLLNELREQEYNAVTSKNYAEAEKIKCSIEELVKEIENLTNEHSDILSEVSLSRTGLFASMYILYDGKKRWPSLVNIVLEIWHLHIMYMQPEDNKV